MSLYKIITLVVVYLRCVLWCHRHTWLRHNLQSYHNSQCNDVCPICGMEWEGRGLPAHLASQTAERVRHIATMVTMAKVSHECRPIKCVRTIWELSAKGVFPNETMSETSNSLHCMKPNGSLLCSQQPATEANYKATESDPVLILSPSVGCSCMCKFSLGVLTNM
jgi:hypothetical protein